MASATPTSMLTDAMLKRFADRAPGYDRENRFFEEDFNEMKQAGYLTAAVPRELGGGGLTFAQMMHEQRRLAYYAHATALEHLGADHEITRLLAERVGLK